MQKLSEGLAVDLGLYRAIIASIAAVLILEIVGVEVSAEIQYNRFGFPNTWNAIRVIADQLPTDMTEGQAQLLEEEGRHLPVVVLAGVNQEGLQIRVPAHLF